MFKLEEDASKRFKTLPVAFMRVKTKENIIWCPKRLKTKEDAI
jgi:hypothetical protein